MSTDLSIVIVSWNVADLLGACLESIYSGAQSRLGGDSVLRVGERTVEVFVVDNASTDGSVEMVRSKYPHVSVIASEVNLGFTRGNNLALERCRGRYVLLLNPDTELVGDALTGMVEHMEGHLDVGLLGPRLVHSDGTTQSSRRRFPTLATALMEGTLLHQWWPCNPWARSYHMADSDDDFTQSVDWVSGACMLVRRRAIDQVGLLDEAFFMYSEEMDWCRRMVDAGWRVVYLPTASVIHHEGQSSDQVVAERHIHFQTSKVTYFRKHHGQAQAEMLRWFLLATYLFQLAEESLKWALGHKRALRRSRMAAYARVLGSWLRPLDKIGAAPR